MEKTSDILEVRHNANQELVATVMLNGYNITGEGPLGQQGVIRSFKVVQGDLFDPWDAQETLRLKDQAGREADIRVAALPVDEDSFGLLEFL